MDIHSYSYTEKKKEIDELNVKIKQFPKSDHNKKIAQHLGTQFRTWKSMGTIPKKDFDRTKKDFDHTNPF